MTTPPERIEEVKTWFEANYLDGDAVQDGQMLASSECLDALITQQQSHHQELQKAREAERKSYRRDLCAFAIQSIEARFDTAKSIGMSHEALKTFVIESFVLPKDNKESILSENEQSELDQPKPIEIPVKGTKIDCKEHGANQIVIKDGAGWCGQCLKKSELQKAREEGKGWKGYLVVDPETDNYTYSDVYLNRIDAEKWLKANGISGLKIIEVDVYHSELDQPLPDNPNPHESK